MNLLQQSTQDDYVMVVNETAPTINTADYENVENETDPVLRYPVVRYK